MLCILSCGHVNAVVRGDARLFPFLRGAFPYSLSGSWAVVPGVVAATALPSGSGHGLAHKDPRDWNKGERKATPFLTATLVRACATETPVRCMR
jgi:hypothetical protein